MESLGEEPAETPPRSGGGSGVAIFQAALCVLALLALVALKITDHPLYDRFTGWYRQESAREIQLPALTWPGQTPESDGEPEPASSSPAVSASPAPEPEIGSLQEI